MLFTMKDLKFMKEFSAPPRLGGEDDSIFSGG